MDKSYILKTNEFVLETTDGSMINSLVERSMGLSAMVKDERAITSVNSDKDVTANETLSNVHSNLYSDTVIKEFTINDKYLVYITDESILYIHRIVGLYTYSEPIYTLQHVKSYMLENSDLTIIHRSSDRMTGITVISLSDGEVTDTYNLVDNVTYETINTLIGNHIPSTISCGYTYIIKDGKLVVSNSEESDD